MIDYCARLYTSLLTRYYNSTQMVNLQRNKNDRITEDRREVADEIKRNNRIKNDALTAEKREKADQIVSDHRLRNDEMTDARRRANDKNPWRTLAISLLIIAVLAVGAYYLFTYYPFT